MRLSVKPWECELAREKEGSTGPPALMPQILHATEHLQPLIVLNGSRPPFELCPRIDRRA